MGHGHHTDVSEAESLSYNEYRYQNLDVMMLVIYNENQLSEESMHDGGVYLWFFRRLSDHLSGLTTRTIHLHAQMQ